MQPDSPSRHPVGGFPADENAVLCKPLTEFARKELSDLPPGEEKPGNHDDHGKHNQAEQNPQTTAAARRRPRMRLEIAHIIQYYLTTRDRTKTYSPPTRPARL